MCGELFGEVGDVVCKVGYLMVKRVNVRGIGENGGEGVEVIVEVGLEVGGGLELLVGGEMGCSLDEDEVVLVFELVVGVVGIKENDWGKGGMVVGV